MAVNTSKELRNKVMYSIFVRQYSEEGTFEALRKDLSRIRNLGTDIIWLMPIHPIGEVNRKGSLGSPYAIRDYRSVNPEFGTMEDFKRLVSDIHGLGMKCIIDVVYNHTSPDSVLAKEHPEWFYHKPDGSFGNKVGDWSDVIDLNYDQRQLWDYQIETLKRWASIVDGFRCDVAPLVPLAFWLKAREETAKVKPDLLWLSESVEPDFIRELRSRGVTCLSDSEIFQAFDVSYEYDVYSDFNAYLKGTGSLAEYAAALNRQESIYPDNYVKLRFLENHDRERAASLIPDEKALRNWTAFSYFQKGLTLLYNGQEAEDRNCPSLFDKDSVHWDTGHDLSSLTRELYEIKKDPLFTDSDYRVKDAGNDVLVAVHSRGARKLVGIFSLKGKAPAARVGLPDGAYRDILGKRSLEIKDGRIQMDGNPIILAL